MAIVINGSGTVTGISVGGLPDGIVDAGTLANNAVDSDQLAADAVGLAQMAGGTDGNIITYDTSGNPAFVATGSDGQILTSAGADAVPAFEAAPGGGKVLQVVGGTDQATTNITSTSFTDSGSNLSITPSATSSKILVLFSGHPRMYSASSSSQSIWTLYRDSTDLGEPLYDSGFLYPYVNASGEWDSKTVNFCYLDSPNTTSSVTYTIYGRMLYVNGRCQLATGSSYNQWTLLEIGV
jgi:hypothetical protein